MSTGTSATADEEPTSTGSLDIELLALDLGTCTRCKGSLANIKAALALTQPVLDTVGIDVRVHGRVIETEDQARRYRFVASPTIRIDGVDIVPDIRETV